MMTEKQTHDSARGSPLRKEKVKATTIRTTVIPQNLHRQTKKKDFSKQSSANEKIALDIFFLLWYVFVLGKEDKHMAKKRANGEGNIRKRKDGRWEGRYTAGYDPATGKRIIKNVLGKTQAEVKEKLFLAIDESKQLDVSREDYTVAQWLRLWYKLYAQPNVRTATANRSNGTL